MDNVWSCGKASFNSYSEASKRLKKQKTFTLKKSHRLNTKIVPYRCVTCSMWHIGKGKKV